LQAEDIGRLADTFRQRKEEQFGISLEKILSPTHTLAHTLALQYE
jgi:hypothetical protein